jgi:methylated-DNA-[protein]-cysteine S-methyltransferase
MSQLLGCKKTLTTPVGKLAIFATAKGISKVDFLDPDSKSIDFASDETAASHCDAAASWLKNYFQGQGDSYPGPYDFSGTEFQKAVWGQIADISFGSTLTYGEIAHAVRKPHASRAVGAATGANPVPLLIPCHRVMGVSSRITGYSGGEGIPTKKKLLRHEAIEFRD